MHIPNFDLAVNVAEEHDVGFVFGEDACWVHDVCVRWYEYRDWFDVVNKVVAFLFFFEVEDPQHEVPVVDRDLQIFIERWALEWISVSQIPHKVVLVYQKFVSMILKVNVSNVIVDDFLSLTHSVIDQTQFTLITRHLDVQLDLLDDGTLLAVQNDLIPAQLIATLVPACERDDETRFPLLLLEFQVPLVVDQDLLQVPDDQHAVLGHGYDWAVELTFLVEGQLGHVVRFV